MEGLGEQTRRALGVFFEPRLLDRVLFEHLHRLGHAANLVGAIEGRHGHGGIPGSQPRHRVFDPAKRGGETKTGEPEDETDQQYQRQGDRRPEPFDKGLGGDSRLRHGVGAARTRYQNLAVEELNRVERGAIVDTYNSVEFAGRSSLGSE